MLRKCALPYVGGFVGGAWARTISVTDVNNYAHLFFPGGAFDTWTNKLDNSVIGGGTGGCNWQPIATPWVLSIEGEGGYLKISGSAFDPFFPPVLGPNALIASAKIGNGYEMVTGRVGYAVDRVLLYAKGGVAFLDESVTVTHPAFNAFALPAFVASASNHNARWAVGGGIEWAFAGNWSVKGEYMFIGANNISEVVVLSVNAWTSAFSRRG